MTQEEKQLLLKDLCARLPYGVKVLYWHHKNGGAERRVGELVNVDLRLNCDELVFRTNQYYFESDSIATSKPYLRPMSSMTEEEHGQYMEFIEWSHNDYDGTTTTCINKEMLHKYLDFVYSHHLDDNDMIGRGLALESPEGMYE